MHFRLATVDDAPQIQAIYAPIVTETATSFELTVPTIEDIAGRIKKYTAQYAWLVCMDHHTVTGYAYGSLHRTRTAYQWSTEVSVYVHHAYRKRNIGRALYLTLFDVLALQGYYNAFAGVVVPNHASEALHTAVGFAPIGVYRNIGYKLGKWHDVKWFQRVLRPQDKSPVPPKPIAEFLDSDVYLHALQTGAGQVR